MQEIIKKMKHLSIINTIWIGTNCQIIMGKPEGLILRKMISFFSERVIYLVRHGRYHIERQDLDDQKLTEMGRNQLTETGKYLAGIYKEHHNNEPPEIIISSVSFLLILFII